MLAVTHLKLCASGLDLCPNRAFEAILADTVVDILEVHTAEVAVIDTFVVQEVPMCREWLCGSSRWVFTRFALIIVLAEAGTTCVIAVLAVDAIQKLRCFTVGCTATIYSKDKAGSASCTR